MNVGDPLRPSSGRAAVDPRLRSALEAQLAARRAALRSGAERVGWKLGVGDRESIGGEIAVGYLTSATCLDPDFTYVFRGEGADLRADAEVAVEVARDFDPASGSRAATDLVAGYGVALEIVDLAGTDDAEAVVAANVFHRAVAFGPFRRALPPEPVEARLIVNGEARDAARPADDVVDRVRAAARILSAVGERLQAGDRLITGSVVQVPIAAGDEVVADMGALGRVRLFVAK